MTRARSRYLFKDKMGKIQDKVFLIKENECDAIVM